MVRRRVSDERPDADQRADAGRARDLQSRRHARLSAGVVYVRATVRPDGSLQSCGAETSSGNSKLDAYTCQIIAKRAKFAAAKWPDGTPVYGVIRVAVSWAIADAPIPNDAMLKAMAPDIDLTVNKLPPGAQKVVAVEVQVAADENGKIVACEEDPPVKIDPHRHFPQLVPIACQQADNLQLSPPKGVGESRAVSTNCVRSLRGGRADAASMMRNFQGSRPGR